MKQVKQNNLTQKHSADIINNGTMETLLSIILPAFLYYPLYIFLVEVIQVNEIFGAVIGAGATIAAGIIGLIGVCVSNGKKQKALLVALDKLQNCQIGVADGSLSLSNQIGVKGNNLTQQHSEIRDFIKGDLLNKISETQKTVNHLKITAEYENKSRNQREMLLSENEHRIANAIEETNAFLDIWKKEKELNAQLSRENYELKNENDKLKKQISVLEQNMRQKNNNKSIDLER